MTTCIIDIIVTIPHMPVEVVFLMDHQLGWMCHELYGSQTIQQTPISNIWICTSSYKLQLSEENEDLTPLIAKEIHSPTVQ